ncbi:MAG: ABC transporter ATP-binding protein, partial [Synergistaceae bacterium]|nr:ABC transporter ATP-binding protein [Synergistaceae bacterium]
KNDENLRTIKETKKQISQIEKKISEHEAKISGIDSSLCLPETLKDSQKVQSLMTERSSLERELKNLYSSWEELSLTLEK